MHLLAYYYHWDRDTLVSLKSRERKMWVSMLREQIELENKANSGEPDFDPDFLKE